MARTIRRWLQCALVCAGLATAQAALAITNVDVAPTGPRASETTIRLFDTNNNVVPPAPGTPNRYANVASGTYTAEVVVGGSVVGTRQTIRLGDGNHVLRPDSATGVIGVSGPTMAGPDPWGSWADPGRPSLRVGVHYGSVKVPQASIGTLIPAGAGSERNAVDSERDLTGVLANLRWTSPWGDIEVEYIEGDDTKTASEPVGGANIGFVYYQPSATGSLGLNTGPTGGQFRLRTDVEAFDFRYTFPWRLWRSRDDPDCRFDLRPTLSFARLRTDYDGWAQNTTVPDVYSATNQRVEEDRYGVGMRGNYMRRLSDTIVGRVIVDVDLYYRDADLASSQNNVCGAAGCSPAATFTATNHDSDRSWTFGVGFVGGIDYAINRQLSVGIEGGYRYVDETAALRNPTRTINLDPAPHLGTQSLDFWHIGASVRYTF